MLSLPVSSNRKQNNMVEEALLCSEEEKWRRAKSRAIPTSFPEALLNCFKKKTFCHKAAFIRSLKRNLIFHFVNAVVLWIPHFCK